MDRTRAGKAYLRGSGLWCLIRRVTPENRVPSPSLEQPGSKPPGVRSAWIWIGLALALVGRILYGPHPGRGPGLATIAFFIVPFAVLTWITYRIDSAGAPFVRVLRAALFSFLAIEAFYFGISIGGLAAAAGAFVIFTRFIAPSRQAEPASE